MNANIMINTISNQEFRDFFKFSEPENPEGDYKLSFISETNRYRLECFFNRRKDEIEEVCLFTKFGNEEVDITEHQMEVLQKYMSDKSYEFAKKDANYMTSYDYAIKNGWSYGD